MSYEYESVSVQFSVKLPFEVVVERFLNAGLTKVTVHDDVAHFRTISQFSVRVSKQEAASLTTVSVGWNEEGIGSMPQNGLDSVRMCVGLLKDILGT